MQFKADIKQSNPKLLLPFKLKTIPDLCGLEYYCETDIYSKDSTPLF